MVCEFEELNILGILSYRPDWEPTRKLCAFDLEGILPKGCSYVFTSARDMKQWVATVGSYFLEVRLLHNQTGEDGVLRHQSN